ncbi:hypothetical protein LTR85_001221 [Meristemomyces frigidus]|nr:hypothetical protein LTR85_001221 [Meristemomyces frigidus]
MAPQRRIIDWELRHELAMLSTGQPAPDPREESAGRSAQGQHERSRWLPAPLQRPRSPPPRRRPGPRRARDDFGADTETQPTMSSDAKNATADHDKTVKPVTGPSISAPQTLTQEQRSQATLHRRLWASCGGDPAQYDEAAFLAMDEAQRVRAINKKLWKLCGRDIRRWNRCDFDGAPFGKAWRW